jgi:DNA adenine methylase
VNAPITLAAPTRPVLRWHGGKWKLAPWIVAHFPPHRIYVESFGGSASVLMRKPRALFEVYNDLDGDVVNLFRVLRDEREQFSESVRLTPAARDEFNRCFEPSDNPTEAARRYLFRSALGHGGKKEGFRPGSANKRSGHEVIPAREWANYCDQIPSIAERLRGVTIENRPAIDVIRQHDAPDCLHYADPPYLPHTRTAPGIRYKEEMSEREHVALLNCLRAATGMVVVSGYGSSLYDHSLSAWLRIEKQARDDSASDRTEVLWVNPRAYDTLDRDARGLFALSSDQRQGDDQ